MPGAADMDRSDRSLPQGSDAGPGEQEHRLATAAVAQQVSQVASTIVMLVVVTALARTLSLAEFGTYGLLVSLATYLLLVQTSVEASAIKAIAEALDPRSRERAFSTAVTLYVIAGILTGLVIAGAGVVLAGAIGIPPGLETQARLGALALGATTMLGWPLKAFQDALRGTHRFVEAALGEFAGYLASGVASITLLVVGAPLWTLVAAGGSIPALIGLSCLVIVKVRGVGVRYRRSAVDRTTMQAFLGLSSTLFVTGLADLVIYALDRVVLAAFRSAATVGLYEGPVRAHNLVRTMHGTLVVIVLPAAARYLSEGDEDRVRDLLLRGTRYVAAIVVPVVVCIVCLAEPLLVSWLGARFAPATLALSLLVGYWLLNVNTGVGAAMLVAAGRARRLAVVAWAVAIANITLSIALAPVLGLNGVVLGTVIPYVMVLPYFLYLFVMCFPVVLADFAREVWVPVYSTAAAVAAGIIVLRSTVGIHGLESVVLTGVAGVLLYWGVFYAAWLRPEERRLVRSVARAAIPGAGH